ncbi:MAG: 16S rRNA (cytosine(1402)-N(4))-methyltransferase RsmH [Clostridiaceae bacterium]
MEFKHVSVLLNECIEALDIKEGGIYVDCTMGGGGHSKEILGKLKKTGRLIGIDQDTNALEASRERLKEYSNVSFIHDNFYNIDNILEAMKIDKVDGILMDLGVSSHQLDEAERGFSYMKDAPLDMRMDREKSLSAYEVVNTYSEEELYRIIKEYGEERFAKKIARIIVERRAVKPLETTFGLVDVIKAAIPAKFRREGHPGKKTFQAIRIEVNQELQILDKAIKDSIGRLNHGGRIAIITFHSLEDRLVKNIFREQENPCTCPKDFPMCVCGKKPTIKIITKKPIIPGEKEMDENSRSKSAKLRVAEKL